MLVGICFISYCLLGRQPKYKSLEWVTNSTFLPKLQREMMAQCWAYILSHKKKGDFFLSFFFFYKQKEKKRLLDLCTSIRYSNYHGYNDLICAKFICKFFLFLRTKNLTKQIQICVSILKKGNVNIGKRVEKQEHL